MDLTSTQDVARQTGVRGGSERFSWESLKSISRSEREHYLGQSVQVGISKRKSKFYKHDWYIKAPNFKQNHIKSTAIHNERENYKIREQNLMNKLLGISENYDNKRNHTNKESSFNTLIDKSNFEVEKHLEIKLKEMKLNKKENNEHLSTFREKKSRRRSFSRSP